MTTCFEILEKSLHKAYLVYAKYIEGPQCEVNMCIHLRCSGTQASIELDYTWLQCCFIVKLKKCFCRLQILS